MNSSKLLFLCALTLIFFALNSILCKAALLSSSIDAFSFSFIRAISAVFILVIVLHYFKKAVSFNIKNDWINSIFLFIYIITFSYAYIGLDAGLGALILFACVQITMILFAFYKKEKITKRKVTGVLVAFLGLSYLLFPNDEFEISIFHFSLMAVCGISWAGYSILGRSSKEALRDTTNSFIKAAFLLSISSIFFINKIEINFYGVFLAFLSGAITSALAYALWYYLLKEIKISTASIIQLLVPVIAIFISVLFLNEELTNKLILATTIILIGILLSLYEKKLQSSL